ncbi:MAG: hypothetical protein R2710_24340 [Acidimicrobiales bacterium]
MRSASGLHRWLLDRWSTGSLGVGSIVAAGTPAALTFGMSMGMGALALGALHETARTNTPRAGRRATPLAGAEAVIGWIVVEPVDGVAEETRK